MDIQVVLTENDPKLGKRGQVIKVSPGYAQNYLFPHHKAKPATVANLKEFDREKEKNNKEEAQILAEAQALAERVRNAELRLEVMAGDGDKLFGAITSQHLVEGLARLGIVCDRKKAHLEEPIKKIGKYLVEFKLHPEVHAKLKVEVVKKT